MRRPLASRLRLKLLRKNFFTAYHIVTIFYHFFPLMPQGLPPVKLQRIRSFLYNYLKYIILFAILPAAVPLTAFCRLPTRANPFSPPRQAGRRRQRTPALSP